MSRAVDARAGTVGKEDSGRWYFRIDVSEPGRPRKQVRRRGFRRERDALEALSSFRKQLDRADYVRPDKTTLAGYLLRWCDTLELRGLRPSTISSYRANVERHIVDSDIGAMKLGDVRFGDLDAVYATFAAHGPHPRQR